MIQTTDRRTGAPGSLPLAPEAPAKSHAGASWHAEQSTHNFGFPPHDSPPVSPGLLRRGFLPAALSPLALLLGPADMAVIGAVARVASPTGDGFATAPMPTTDILQKVRKGGGGVARPLGALHSSLLLLLQGGPVVEADDARRQSEFVSHVLSSKVIHPVPAGLQPSH